MHNHRKLHLACLVSLICAGPAYATDGYFPHGFGMKAKGMGGAAVASTDNAFAGINNPAASAWAGNRLDAGLDLFMPKRSAARTAPGFGGMLEGDVTSQGDVFPVPEFAYNRSIDSSKSWGITVYGNGGMNTQYPGGSVTCADPTNRPMTGMNLLCGQGKLGVDLMQLIVAPTLGYKLNDRHAIGVSPLVVVQQFQAWGLHAFTGSSQAPGQVTNRGADTSHGLGVRLGYLGKVTDSLAIGASYTPQIRMSKFDKYAGLFAQSGAFDIPENYALGLNLAINPSVSVAADYVRINYSKVRSIGNPMSQLLAGNPMGSAHGPGFGWSDVDVFKLGVQWQATPKLVLRAGFNQSTNPVKSDNITFNILAPGVMTKHYTLGGTYALDKQTEISWAYMMAPKSSVTGNSMYNMMIPGAAGIQETVRMSQQSIGIQFSRKF